MSVISRLYNFVAGTPAIADSVDAEFDQIIAKINNDLIHRDGMSAFTAVQAGITPTATAHLTTKGYVDGLISGVSGGGGIVVRKTADEQVVSSTVQQNDDHLFFAMVVNKAYRVQMTILTSSSVSTALKPSFTTPTGTVVRGKISHINVAPALGSLLVNYSTYFDAVTPPSVLPTGPTVIVPILVDAVVICGSTAGNFQFQWSQNTAVANPLIVHANSFLTHQLLNP
jgi:hypothetical protein